MSRILRFDDYMMLIAEYNSPEIHKHLASHIIISLGKEIQWNVENNNISCRGICINSNVKHRGIMQKEGAIVFLFTEISDFSVSLNEKYLKGKSYEVLDDNIVDKILEEYDNNLDMQSIANPILNICEINNMKKHIYDERIQRALKYIDDVETIDNKIIDDICGLIYISKSRLSHLFKEQTGMTMHSYLAFEKIKKTSKYIGQGMNITNACLNAGFDSSSHFSSTCKRMFGISLRDVYKTIEK